MRENHESAIGFTIIALIIAVCLWVWGYVEGLEDPYSEAIFEDCKELKIDTLLYNYRDSTYVTAS